MLNLKSGVKYLSLMLLGTLAASCYAADTKDVKDKGTATNVAFNQSFIPKEYKTQGKPNVLIISMVEDMKMPIKIATQIRKSGKNAEIYLNDKKLKAKLKYADKLEIPYVIIIGEDELKTGMYKLKNMETGEETEYKIEDI